MKNTIAGVSTALLCCLAAYARPAENKPATNATAEQHRNLTGCLQKGPEPNTFVLRHVKRPYAKGTKDWELVDVPARLKLSDHVGHKVEVSGEPLTMREAEKLEGETVKASKKERREEREEHHFKVTGLKHLSPTCP